MPNNLIAHTFVCSWLVLIKATMAGNMAKKFERMVMHYMIHSSRSVNSLIFRHSTHISVLER